MDFLSRRGYWTAHMRYRGTWESGGRFLARPPHEDVLDVARAMRRGFDDVWGGGRVSPDPKEVIVMGASFGGMTAIMASLSDDIAKAVALAPVVDWRQEGKRGLESPAFLHEVIREGYGGAYRFSPNGWRELVAGRLSNPWDARGDIDSEKLLLFHAQDDDVTPFRMTSRFAKASGCAFVPRKHGGHLSLSALMRPMNWTHVERFLRERRT